MPVKIVLRPHSHAFDDLKRLGVASELMHVKQTGHDLVVGVKGSPRRLALRQVFENIGWICAQVSWFRSSSGTLQDRKQVHRRDP